jgi:hypothetical protein
MSRETQEVSATMAGVEVVFRAPLSDCVVNDVLEVAAKSKQRAAGAALGVCWRGKRRPKARLEPDYSMARYGGAVWDELRGRGLSRVEVMTAGAEVYVMLSELDRVPSESEVKEAEGNSEGKEGQTS